MGPYNITCKCIYSYNYILFNQTFFSKCFKHRISSSRFVLMFTITIAVFCIHYFLDQINISKNDSQKRHKPRKSQPATVARPVRNRLIAQFICYSIYSYLLLPRMFVRDLFSPLLEHFYFFLPFNRDRRARISTYVRVFIDWLNVECDNLVLYFMSPCFFLLLKNRTVGNWIGHNTHTKYN